MGGSIKSKKHKKDKAKSKNKGGLKKKDRRLNAKNADPS